MLLLTSALFVFAPSVVAPPQKAHAIGLTVNLYSQGNVAVTSGKYGDVVMVKASTTSAADWTSCSIGGSASGMIGAYAVKVFSGVAYGYFTVGSAAGGPSGAAYTITVTCGSDSGTVNFNVLPSVTFSSYSNLAGRRITVTGVGFASDANVCDIIDAGGGAHVSSYICGVGSGSLSGSFAVAGAGTFQVFVRPNKGVAPAPNATFTVVAAPTVFVSPTSAPPGYGTAGSALVGITGSGFANGTIARSCTLGATPAGLTPFAAQACTINTDGTVTGGFAIAQTATPATYTISVTDSGDLSVHPTVNFVLTASPAIFTNLPKSAGQLVTVTNSSGAFSKLDAGPCSILSNPSGLAASTFCLIDNKGALWSGIALNAANFTVSSTAPDLSGSTPSSYSVTIKGAHGDSSSVSSSVATDNPSHAVTVSPTYGSPPIGTLVGTPVHVTGTGFRLNGTGCDYVQSSPTGLISSLFCAYTPSQGVLDANFVVATLATNQSYTVTAKATGDPTTASTTFHVLPRIILNPTSGVGGQTIAVLGSGFKGAAAGTCFVEAWQSGAIISPTPFSATSCGVDANGIVTASFAFLNSIANGVYTIKVAGHHPGNDNATTTFTKGVPVALTITPYSGFTGTGPVSVTGTFTSLDAGTCSIVAPAGSNLFAGVPTPTCTISSSGALTASFYVSTTAQGGTWALQVIGAGGGFGTGNFAVTPKMTLTPASGESFTLVTVAGSGFSAADAVAGCASLYSTPLGLTTAVSCSISATTFEMTGTFVVSGAVAPGSYSVVYPSSLGLVSASFTKSPSAFTLTPNSGPTGTIVFVAGTGFTPTDTSCTITASPNIVSSQTCSITGGVVTGSFTVVGAAAPGVSTVTVTSNPSGTSKSAPFQLTPTIVLSPTSGRANTIVSISGSNFVVSDTGCTITSSPSGLISSPSCVLVAGTMSGSFTVASVSGGNYTVLVTGTAGDAGQATFRAPSAPTLTLNPTSGTSGTAVTATGSSFAGTTCQITSSPGGLFLSSSCSLAGGSLTSGSGFTVSSGATVGTAYTVTVTTNLGGTDSATASFIVAAGPLGTLTLVPTSGPIGTPVSGQATGFTTDTSCQLTATPQGLLSSASCTITGGGNANVGFIVSSSATPGPYTVLVVGNTGKAAATTTPFTVTATPSFILSANPSSLTLNPGGTANVDVTVQSFGGFSSPVALVASLPTGVSGGLAPNPVTPTSGGSVHSTLSLVVSSTAPSTTAIITVAGAGGGLSTQTTIMLVIQSTVTTATTTSVATSTGPWTPPKCVIATATFGSEVSPAVQFLRNFRDRLVLSTTAGSAFMQVFNAWYYSFSPSVAQFIASNDPIRAPIRVFLYPLLGVLSVSAFTYSLFSATPEFGIVMAGLVASSLIGLVYLTLPALVGVRALRKRRVITGISIARIAMASLATALLLIAVGEFAQSFVLLAVASSAIVLICVIAVPTIAAFAILRPNKE